LATVEGTKAGTCVGTTGCTSVGVLAGAGLGVKVSVTAGIATGLGLAQPGASKPVVSNKVKNAPFLIFLYVHFNLISKFCQYLTSVQDRFW
jgi:hypothetical protein